MLKTKQQKRKLMLLPKCKFIFEMVLVKEHNFHATMVKQTIKQKKKKTKLLQI